MADILRLVDRQGRECTASDPTNISRLLYTQGYRLTEPNENWPLAPVAEPTVVEPDPEPAVVVHTRVAMTDDATGSDEPTDPAPADDDEDGTTTE